MILILHVYEAWCGWFGEVGILSGGTYKELTAFGKYVDRFIRNLGIGVDIFFLLSGFLITYLLLVEKQKNNSIDIGKFMIRRILRIWPLYFFIVAISPFLVSWLDSTPEPNYFANAFFLGNFDLIKTQHWTFPFSHFWSICIEEHFYLFWPFIIAFIPLKHLLKFLLGFIGLSIAFRIYSSLTMDYPWFTLYLHTLSRMDEIVIGAIGVYFYFKKPFQLSLNWKWRIVLLVILIAVLSIDIVSDWGTWYKAAFKKYFYLLIFSLLLIDYNFNTKFRHLIKPKSILHYLGKISYGIYMYGNIVFFFVIKKIMWEYNSSNMWLFIFANIFITIGISVISYELLEKPFLKISKRFRIIDSKR